MTIRNAIDALLQRFKEPATPATLTVNPESEAPPYVGEDPWLMELYDRLQSELDSLYETADQNDRATRQRIAQILRSFHRMEMGDYGACACCDADISRERLEADPTRNTCDDCG